MCACKHCLHACLWLGGGSCGCGWKGCVAGGCGAEGCEFEGAVCQGGVSVCPRHCLMLLTCLRCPFLCVR